MLYTRPDDLCLDHPRHYCRNPHCRAKLPDPVSNPREAFCARGCHAQFYRKHCLVCEAAIEQPDRGQRKLCKKAACRSAWLANVGFGHFASSNAKPTQEVPGNNAPAGPLPACRPWRIIAGPTLTPSQFHCATVSDGPNEIRDGGYRRIEANNKAALETVERARQREEIEAGGYFGEPGWREVISAGDVKCFVTRYMIVASVSALIRSSAPIMSSPVVGDGLAEIPPFLKREISRPRDQPQENDSTSCTTPSCSFIDR